MTHPANNRTASKARSFPTWSWCGAIVLLAVLGIVLMAGEYRAQSVTPDKDVLFDSLLRGPSSSGFTGGSSIISGPQPATDADACNTGCQRLGQELQSLLWGMTAEKTALAPSVALPPPKAAPVQAEKCPLPDLASLDPAWSPLIKRLVVDGYDEAEMQSLFAGLGPKSYTPAYMAAKIRELYGVQGVGIKQIGNGPVLPEDYQQPLSDFTLGSCVAFIKKYSVQLQDIERRHGVPARYIVGLLLIETGLGSDLGSHSAFRALASMASTNSPKLLGSAGNGKQVKYVRQKALANTLREKSNWAYNEVKALIAHSKANHLDICSIPGSIYGAVGICQFMPSNISPYAVDGDKDGRVDVFSVVDAMYSVANYLEASGWRGARSDSGKLLVFKAYNKDDYYAASVLAASNQLGLAQKGKVAHSRNALAGVISRPRASGGGYLDPSLRNLKPVPESAKITLDSYN